MRRSGLWLERILIGILLFFIAGHFTFSHFIPSHVARLLRQAAGQTLTVGRVRVGFPLRLILSEVSLAQANPGTLVRSRQVVVVPQWLSWRKKTLWVRTVEIDEPRIQVGRMRDGKFNSPADLLPSASSSTPSSGDSASPPTTSPTATAGSSWRIIIQTVQVSGGTIEFVDEQTTEPFRAALTDLSLVGGPVAFPPTFDYIALAIQGRLVGAQQLAAPVYCSGWMDLNAKDLDVSCQVEPLRLAAFEPSYHQQGPLQVHSYDATLRATGRLTAKANVLDGRVQLTIDNLSEGDLTFLGKTLAEIKKGTGESERTLTGELQISGPLDRSADWRIQLAPGNEIVQRLVKPLLDRGGGTVPIKVGKQTIQVGITTADEAVMSNIEAASKTVEESLKILAPASPSPEAPPLASAPSSEATAEQPATSPTPAPEQAPPSPAQAQGASSGSAQTESHP